MQMKAFQPLHTVSSRIRGSYKLRAIRQRIRQDWLMACAIARRSRLSYEIRRRTELHIHFGCGNIDDARFINVDARPFPHVHLVTKSPLLREFREGAVHSIYACHVLEHFPIGGQRKILRRWHSLLAPGGTLRLSVPDFDKLVSRYNESGGNPESIQYELMGGQDYSGNFHYAIFTAGSLSRLLVDNGFVNICSWHPRNETDWPRDYSWDDRVSLNLIAEKPR